MPCWQVPVVGSAAGEAEPPNLLRPAAQTAADNRNAQAASRFTSMVSRPYGWQEQQDLAPTSLPS
jgi:hypothetical protein